MKKLLAPIIIIIIFQSCISKKVNEVDVFNPIKEFELNTGFSFNRNLIPTNDSTQLETWYITEPNAQFNLIYLSGNGSNIRSAIPFFNALGTQTNLNIFSFNYSGFGLSTGNPTINGIVNDANIALQHFNLIKNNSLPTILLGYSLGGYVALKLSNNPTIDKVILMSTFSSLKELEVFLKKESLPFIIRPFLKITIEEKVYGLTNLEEIKNLEKPLLVIHGGSDNFIPPTMGKKLYDSSPSINKKFVQIDGADHRMVLKDDEKSSQVAVEIIRFVNSNQTVSK